MDGEDNGAGGMGCGVMKRQNGMGWYDEDFHLVCVLVNGQGKNKPII